VSSPAPTIPGDIAASAQPDYLAWWQTFFYAFLQNIPQTFEGLKQYGSPAIAEIAATLVELSIELTAEIGKRMGQAIDEFEAQAGPEILRAAAAGLSDYFGVPIAAGQIDRNRPTSERFRFAETLGRQVLEQMFGAFSAPKGITPDVGLDNAERLLGFNIATALEGWLGKVTTTTPLTRWIPNWADLDDVMSANLGLGRANRRVMGPLLKALIVDPLTWDINRRFTPSRLSVSELIRAKNRAAIDEATFHEQMRWHGYDQATTSKLEILAAALPAKEDVSRMLELELVDTARAAAIFRALGYSDDGAEMMVQLALEDRVRSLNNSLETLGRDMYRDREIDEPELRAILKSAGRGPVEVETLIGIASLERERPRPLSRADVEEGFRRGLIPLNRLREYYSGFGYALEDQVLLEEMAVEDRQEQERRDELARTQSKGGDFRLVPAAQIEGAYVQGLVPAARLREYYDSRGYSSDDVALLVELAARKKTERDRKLELALEKAKTPAIRELSKGEVEEAFIRDVIDAGRLRDWYGSSGVRPEDVPVLLETARQKKAERVERLASELERARTPRYTDLPRSVVEEAFIRGGIDAARLRAWYEAQGYRAEEIPILLELVSDRKRDREKKPAAGG
jgi:hypothetical protein